MTAAARPGNGQPVGRQHPQQSQAEVRRASHLDCESADKKAQKIDEEGRLVTAGVSLRSCAKANRGVCLEHQCTFRYVRIESNMPSVVATATDASGKPVIEVTLKVDGTPLTSRLDGHAVPVNPGLPEFSFETSNGLAARRKVWKQHSRYSVKVKPTQSGALAIFSGVF